MSTAHEAIELDRQAGEDHDDSMNEEDLFGSEIEADADRPGGMDVGTPDTGQYYHCQRIDTSPTVAPGY